jgi:hypothetical protein
VVRIWSDEDSSAAVAPHGYDGGAADRADTSARKSKVHLQVTQPLQGLVGESILAHSPDELVAALNAA